MQSYYLYYKYIIKPQLLLKIVEISNFKQLTDIGLKKININIYLFNTKKNYYIYLYNVCILIRLILNKFFFIKKIYKMYILNKILLELNLKGNQMYLFLDVFGTILLPVFENFNMGLKEKNFDIFGNYKFEFNYADPIFMSKNTVIV